MSISCTSHTSDSRWCSLQTRSKSGDTSAQGGMARSAEFERCAAIVKWPAKASRAFRGLSETLVKDLHQDFRQLFILMAMTLDQRSDCACQWRRQASDWYFSVTALANVLSVIKSWLLSIARGVPLALRSRMCSTKHFIPPANERLGGKMFCHGPRFMYTARRCKKGISGGYNSQHGS